MTHIVKRRGHKEPFDERKVYASVYAACLASHILHEEAESIANLVAREIKREVETQEEVTAEHIFKLVVDELEYLNKEAAFMYKTHRDIS